VALRSTLVSLVAAAALALSCASPTLPLPPPAAPSIIPSTTAGKYHLQSAHGAEPNAIVIIYNRNPNVPLDQRVSGAQADGGGSWDAEVIATPGDYLDVTQEFGTNSSPTITVQIPR
jgi:hypothetical protein